MPDTGPVELIAELGSGAREVGRARRALARALPAWGVGGEQAETAVLLTSELVTNAIRHGRPPVELRAGLGEGGELQVAVDDVERAPVELRSPPLEDPGGRGLQLVDVLADRWGTRLVLGGKRVWFELGGR